VAAMDQLHIEQVALELEPVDVYYYSCPSDCMAQVVAAVALGMAAVLLGGWNFLRTCYCSCEVAALEIEVSVDIGSWVRHTGSKLLHVLGLCELELEQPVPVVCLGLQLVAAAESQAQVTDLLSLTSGSLGAQMDRCTSPG